MFLATDMNGSLDYCLEDLMAVVNSDLLGDVAEQKEVEKIASKMKETKKRMSFESLKLIAQSVTFRTHALKLISPMSSHLQKQLTPKLKSKLEMMLVGIDRRLLLGSTVGSYWDRPSALAGIDRRL
jgi:U3 small nucleolar RNA-associated protein 20